MTALSICIQISKFPQTPLITSVPKVSQLRNFGMGLSIKPTTMARGLLFPGAVNRHQTSSFMGIPLRLSMSTPQPSLPSLLLNVQAKARTSTEDRQARHSRIRKKVEGTPDRPRLCVFRSNKHLSVQVIDDSKMHTLASASTMQKELREEIDYSSGPTIEVAKKIGEFIAKSCLEKGITKVAFDRGGYPYHGRIEALADSAREHGLQF